MARVLVVDDDENIREFVSLALMGEGHEVNVASNGAVALDVVGMVSPDVILLDMRMPVMDGWQFASAYREMPGQRAHVVVMTAARDAARSGAEISADANLAKPFELDELLDLVEQLSAKASR
jgi:two-component system, chemotaxis family, chemotaxis protein CheY